MRLNKYLTIEPLLNRFNNQFELVQYAIRLAKNMIISGRDPYVFVDNKNKSTLVLEEIFQRKDKLVDLRERRQEYDHAAPKEAAVKPALEKPLEVAEKRG